MPALPWRKIPTGEAQYVRIDDDARPSERRRLMRETGLTREQVGLPAPWFSQLIPAGPRTIEIYFLQKNSSVPRRIRAVAASKEQMLELDAINRLAHNHSAYAWAGHRLDLGRSEFGRDQLPAEIHALVYTRYAYARPNIESRVRVTDVYSDREDAERALKSIHVKHPAVPWAVITYPVGVLLF